MHGTSHFLGLDTHDVGLWHLPIQENMVFTCEPGIYIPEEGLGIRIEDDAVVTDQGCELISRGVPVDPLEIEAIVRS